MTIQSNLLVLTIIATFFMSSCDNSNDPNPQDPDQQNAPVITSITPEMGQMADTVTIHGENFVTDTSRIKVNFTGKYGLILEASETDLVVQIPWEWTGGAIRIVVDEENYSEFYGEFEWRNPPYSIYSMSPFEGSAGQQYTIKGDNLPSDSTLYDLRFPNNVKAEVKTISSSSITTVLPYDVEPGLVKLTIDGYRFVPDYDFQVIQGGKWERLADFPNGGAYSNMAVFSIDGFFYAGFGTRVDNGFFKYDPTTGETTQLNNTPAYLYSAFAFAHNGKGYVGSGLQNVNDWSNKVWEYDPATDSWTQLDDFPGAGRSHSAYFQIGDKGYVFGGQLAGSSSRGNDLWEFDLAQKTWTQKTSLPALGRESAAAFTIEDRAYIFGGTSINDDLNDFWSYDPGTDQWTELDASVITPRYAAVSFALNGKGYIGGGGAYTEDSTFPRDAFEYDPGNNSWRRISNVYDPDQLYSTTVTYNDAAYIFPSLYYKRMYKFTAGN